MPARPPRVDWHPGTFLAVLAGLDADDARAVLQAGSPRTYRDRDVIILEGTAGTEVYVLTAGRVKVSSLAANGARSLLTLRIAGDIVGELAAVDGGKRSSTVQAAGSVEALHIDGPRFAQLRRARPNVGDALQLAMARKLRASIQARVDAGAADAFIQVSRILLWLVEAYGQRTGAGGPVSTPLAQADLAELIGISGPSVTRALKELRDRSVVGTGYRKILVFDPDRLARIAQELE
jgi:CRP/FNR family cyclic AMP-dependent transcriptional regulator